ncbi:MAG: FadR family transcriptional regulator [Oscillibacter sp.]|nr:FadR family transcriptional regulator [Oscillibacter sp.]
MANTTEKRTKLSERAADRLYEMILDEGRYTPGSKLPNELELSQALAVSRTTLREAISFLVAQGVLEIRRGKGTFVAAELPETGLDLSALAGLRTRSRARDLFEMRLIFEPATVALACQRASEEELRQIRGKAERMARIAAEGGDWPLADQEFHWAIIKASHNEYMRRLYPIINSAVNKIMQLSSNRSQMQEIAVSDNRLILEFLLKRDEAGARHAMSIHMRHLINSLPE